MYNQTTLRIKRSNEFRTCTLFHLRNTNHKNTHTRKTLQLLYNVYNDRNIGKYLDNIIFPENINPMQEQDGFLSFIQNIR